MVIAPMCRICKEEEKNIQRGVHTMVCVEFNLAQKQQPSGKCGGSFHES